MARAPSIPPNRRAQTLLDACQPCAAWDPILRWNTPPDQGGPTRAAIEQTMAACGYCSPDAKQRFLGVLDDARGQRSRAPWHMLGELCKAEVSAVPDDRFVSAPYYALDRVARAAAARPETAELVRAIELELPALSVVGVGIDLPTSSVIAPQVGPVVVTVLATETRVARLPRATLAASGLVVDFGGTPYPGDLATPKDLDAAVARALAVAPAHPVPAPPIATGSGSGSALAPAKRPDTIALIAPRAMPAAPLVPVLAALPGRLVVLAVAAHGAPVGWQLPGSVPIPLTTVPDAAAPVLPLDATADAGIAALKAAKNTPTYAIALGPGATVQSLAQLLGAVAYRSPTRVILTLASPPQPRSPH